MPMNAQKLNPILTQLDEFSVFYQQARTAKSRRNFSRLYSLCIDFLKKHPKNIIAHLNLIDMYAYKGEYEKICELIDRLCIYYPDEKQFLNAQKELFEKDMAEGHYKN
ncbi:MAG: hypothetical protein ACD_47C00174G0005 [uncultured bacterium]|uniref:Tetratricopeptide repeat protein n=1 Tax=Candidatus Wallbacteria bacterium GWC2_49_35 TaxID=1817813 RepID=A0A1F7WKN8_9BACT|nr:MAG: hypothetical protein ACD_47C00174G0005 [uncultured bacterium]OGM02969.1 MAG: hypothetical protein A2008_11140 [Candidatus Wallbacteria bacterium GWC2_49_35]HBC76693.1 hypothetical protein [Candidatus Wallbacteria bacterium]